ncbi:hypothetical protein BGZ80_002064 [Entomortierella chlamydospora]|uniref:Uncharacterized protein n=1 Tax=Entomortierella chlamydospora TaxID=101097 RepID=A0A9P6N6Q8_9FUNG|nr:hypothetical protein BGZ80_002064 [Entomortierella chlamydospora]
MQHYSRSGYGHDDATFKVLVLGDSGVVGTKTITSPSPESSSNTSGAETFIEFYDISGSPAVRSPKSRTMFYSGATYQGLILVHDLCNKRSYENLWRWIGDYMEGSQASGRGPGYNGGEYGHLSIPLLVVGTKNDIPASYDQQGAGPKAHGFNLVEKYGGEAMSVCAVSPADFMPSSSASIAFNMFFSRVIDPSSINVSRQRSPLSSTATYPSGAAPIFARPPPTPTPQEVRSQYPEHHTNDSSSGPLSIPILDFATFTGGSTTDSIEDHRVPTRSGSPMSQGQNPTRPITPTEVSSSAATTTKSALRAQYERNRSVLNQYNNMGVPVYTSRSTTPTGPR